MPLLEVKHLSKNFSGLKALDSVDFYVNEGEIVSLIGPNGAGKTTLFNMLTGVYKNIEGEIIFNGESIVGKSMMEIVQVGIARTFQNIRLFKKMRAIENVLVGCHINTNYNFFDLVFRTPRYRKEERLATQKALDILNALGFEEQVESYASSLPYGAQRRLEIARAIATGAKLLLLDEPAAGMNPQETEVLLQFIDSLKKKGFTILLIEHDMNVVMNISERIYVLDYGKLIATGLPSEIVTNPQVVEAYLGRSDKDAED